jgi:hypothetical protein
VIGEPPPVDRRELPRVALVQVGEDRPRATMEATVLALQHRDLACPGDRAQLRPFVRPRLDLPRHEVDPQLRQHFPYRGRERAPLRLVERQHAVRH